MTIPLVPPICPTCGVACLQEFSTPALGSGVVSERNYCPSCGWNPEVDGCPKCDGALVLDANENYVHEHKAKPWGTCDGMRRHG